MKPRVIVIEVVVVYVFSNLVGVGALSKREDESLGNLFQDILKSLEGEGAGITETSTTLHFTTKSGVTSSVSKTTTIVPSTKSSGSSKIVNDKVLDNSIISNGTSSSNVSMTTEAPSTPTQTQGNLSSSVTTNVTGRAEVTGTSEVTGNITLASMTTVNSKELAKMLGFTSPPPSTSTKSSACDTEKKLTSLCSKTALPDLIQEVNIWDVYFTIFSDTIIEALLLNCASGSWCLRNEYDAYKATMLEKAEMVHDSDAFGAMCDSSSRQCIQQVVQGFQNCSVGPRLDLTYEAVDMLCQLRETGHSDMKCFQQIIITLHVSVMDLIRQENKQSETNVGLQDQVCTSAAAKMVSTYLCTTYLCPNHTDVLQSFSPWGWFMKDKDILKTACLYPNNTCSQSDGSLTSSTSIPGPVNIDNGGLPGPTIMTLPAPPSTPESTDTYKDGAIWTTVSDLKTMVGVSIASLIIVIGIVIITVVCWKKYRKSGTKSGYKPLTSHDP